MVHATGSASTTEKTSKIYQKEKNNPNSILYNDIYHITGDKKGHVYIMTNRGISAYDMEKGLFTPIIKKNIRSRILFGTSVCRHIEPDIQI